MITRSVLFSLKCTRKRLAAGLPDPLGELKRSQDPLAVLGRLGPPGREGIGREGKERREGKEGRGGEGKGRKSSSPNVH